MRLDTLGKPLLLQNDHFEKAEVNKIISLKIGEVTHPESFDNSTFSDGRARLGKILNLLENSEEKKKKRVVFSKKNTKGIRAILVYQSASNQLVRSTKGQALDLKV